MQRKRKSIQEVEKLGDALRRRRKELGLTLISLAKIVEVDVGQLSRFERAEFKRMSPNLQKVISYLQIKSTDEQCESEAVIRQFTELLDRSERHKAAAIALVQALQELR